MYAGMSLSASVVGSSVGCRKLATPVAYLGFHKGGLQPTLSSPSLPPSPSPSPLLAPTHLPSQASPPLSCPPLTLEVGPLKSS